MLHPDLLVIQIFGCSWNKASDVGKPMDRNDKGIKVKMLT